MKKVHHNATIPSQAEPKIRKLLDHLDGNPRAGFAVVLSEQVESGVTIQAMAHNFPSEALDGGARLFCEMLLANLRQCRCGADHGRTITQVEQAALLLLPPHAAGVVQ